VAPAVLLGALLAAACYEFRGVGPEDPVPETPPRLVDVTVEYRQPNVCENVVKSCEGPIVFFASWMRPGTEFNLTPDPDTLVYRGTAYGVPVNFPPHQGDFPYQVRVFDPHLRERPSGGFEVERLKVGGELLTGFGLLDTVHAFAHVYVDENGIGHNPL
jgi:hypothetical protein